MYGFCKSSNICIQVSRGRFEFTRTLDILKPRVRTLTQKSGRSNSTVFEQSRVKFDRFLDTTTVYQLDQFSAKSPTSLSIKSLLDQTCQPSQEEFFKFVSLELPIRLANMIMELQIIPKSLSTKPQFREVFFQYIQSFKDLLQFTILPFTPETNDNFVHLLKEVRLRHIDTVPTMAAAIEAMLMEDCDEKMGLESIQYCLDRLYTNRISVQLLISLYKATYITNKTPTRSLMVGTIDPHCDVLAMAREAYADAALLCDREYQEHPELVVEGRDVAARGIVDEVRIGYFSDHLHHMLFEIFKNAMRATVEDCKKKKLLTPAPIKCLVTKTEGDVSIRISDLGGGIRRDMVDKLFLYHFSSARCVRERNLFSGSGGLDCAFQPMHGLGYGLPLSRVYARYFQGDLNLLSMHGVGSDVYIYLKAVAEDAKEFIPKYSIEAANKLHNKKKKSNDWTLI